MHITPSIEQFLNYFADLGPRWGLQAETCRLHALLYLASAPLNPEEIAEMLSAKQESVQVALDDLQQWNMVHYREGKGWYVSGEPWDLLFSALEERYKREMRPALELLRDCSAQAHKDSQTSPAAANRMQRLLRLVEDIAAIDMQAARFSNKSMARMVGFGGQTARLINHLLPTPRDKK